MRRDSFRFFGLFAATARLVGDDALHGLAFDVMDIVHIALRERGPVSGVPEDAFSDRFYPLRNAGVPAWMSTKGSKR